MCFIDDNDCDCSYYTLQSRVDHERWRYAEIPSHCCEKSNLIGSVTVVLGSQWGDEGKGKLVDVLAAEVDVCARCAGGNNAGHTIVVPINGVKKSFAFHLLPSGESHQTCYHSLSSVLRKVVKDSSILLALGCLEMVLSSMSRPSSKNWMPSSRKVSARHPDLNKTLSWLGLDCTGRLFVSDRAQLVFDFHQIVDGLKEVELGGSRWVSSLKRPSSELTHSDSIGTTKKGIGPAYSGKASRSGLRVHHLFDPENFAAKFRKVVDGRFKRYGHFEYDTEGEILRYKKLAERLRPYVVDSVSYVHKAISSGKRVLVEGANALLLDLDFGTYPYVTSSSTSIGGVCTGLGIPPKMVGKTIGVIKAYTTRVGAGPFPTEQLNDVGVHLQEVGREYGTTTGRRRRCGWLDLVVMKHSSLINGYDAYNLTKLDILDQLPEIKVAIKYTLDGKELEGFPGKI